MPRETLRGLGCYSIPFSSSLSFKALRRSPFFPFLFFTAVSYSTVRRFPSVCFYFYAFDVRDIIRLRFVDHRVVASEVNAKCILRSHSFGSCPWQC